MNCPTDQVHSRLEAVNSIPFQSLLALVCFLTCTSPFTKVSQQTQLHELLLKTKNNEMVKKLQQPKIMAYLTTGQTMILPEVLQQLISRESRHHNAIPVR